MEEEKKEPRQLHAWLEELESRIVVIEKKLKIKSGSGEGEGGSE
jgi:hypothetical protein